ncbi:2-polyprenyl-6-methoxyphenol hydroxylase-like FAD-dependent oxidoreductase [Deinococcus metalli]|uniref:2-polyprenyl-6-methoxyphenol hydroxylase n=1 Tax=Deinococcus metalli TaxID=1141878 RepID=A0A7W8NPN0_9DEIO|nr:FAD-dependent monooxygenase [Deinococcus metalli]MBB5378139.1 2-polyprenyl-6-methoxyphenol hydroxylase-like FAD-dependent oxidoreductase [Deinococcus metalli]GHF56317.1 2-polyprenyl-6-methoxyphenol hydroxylase [Deinococcus metalli]
MTGSGTDVVISGAGPTGLMLALWLARLGVRVRVADLKAGPVLETRAIAVQARTLEFYDQLGIGEEALRRGRHFDRISLFVRGMQRAAVRLKDVGDDLTPHPYLYILTQDQNEELLVSELSRLGVTVDWQTEVMAVTQGEDGVTVMFRRAGQDEGVRAAYVAACDGAGSVVRHALGISLSGGTYSQRFFVADVDAHGAVREGNLNLSLDSHQFLAFFPMPQPDRYRVVGEYPPGVDEAVGFPAVQPQLEASRLAGVSAVHWFATYRVHHRVADTFQRGRAFILGDAGHVHTPVGGQGMNTGLGDASNLAWKLAQAVRGRPAALTTYDAERRPFALSLVNTTDRIFTTVVNPSALAGWVRTVLVPLVMPRVMHFRPMRRFLFLTISQTRLHYPDSPLSEGRAGRIAGGQRLPWVRGAAGEGDNFAALRSLSWQVHVYGTPDPALLTWCGVRDLPLRAFPFSARAKRAGLAQDAIYVIRPDGYVGLALPSFDRERLDAYTDRWL